MNRDEAGECLQVARRLLAQADTSDADAADAALDRAMKYAEKAKRPTRTRPARRRTRSSRRSARGSDRRARRILGRLLGSLARAPPGGGGASTAPRGEQPRLRPRRRPAPSRVRGTPEQERSWRRFARLGRYYAILGIPRGATGDEAKKAYRKLALKLHPDKCKATGAEEVFKSVSRAFACLSDDDKRAAYDRYGTEDPSSLGPGGGPRGPGGFERRPFYAEEEIDPSEIFNMFFGGGCARRARGALSPRERAQQAREWREQAAREPRTGRGGRTEARGAAAAAEEEEATVAGTTRRTCSVTCSSSCR